MVTPLSNGFGAISDQFRTFVDETCIELNNRSTGFHFLDGVLSAHDAAGSNDRQRTLEMLGGHSCDFGRTSHKRFAGKAAGFFSERAVLDRFSGNGGIRADYAVHAVLNNDVQRMFDAVIRQVRCNLYGDRDDLAVVFIG